MRVITMALAVFAVFAVFAVVAAADPQPDVVTVEGGQIAGLRDEDANSRAWYAIPYAASTGGANRFMPPQPRAPWSGILNCQQYGAGCISDHHNSDVAPVVSEDCLSLSVFAPLNSTLQGKKLPVMVFLYGGGFNEGFDEGPYEMYNGSYFSVKQEVVVVTLNYRLGALGFLVTDQVNGNLGLMDQRMALQWVQRNIGVFGGDAGDVTLWGESAGAMSTGIHMVTPKSSGLFHKAIMESNPAGWLYLNKTSARDYGFEFCKLLNCSAGPHRCNTACLQRADVDDIIHAWDKAGGNIVVYIRANWGHLEDGFLQFIPTTGDDEVPVEPLAAMRLGKVANPVPVLMGTNTNEGETFIFGSVKYWLPMDLYADAMNIVFGRVNGPKVVQYYSQYKFHDGRLALSRVFTDYWFRCGGQQFASFMSAHNLPSYYYRYDHLLSAASILPKMGLPDVCASLVCHAVELPLVFHHMAFPALDVNLTPAEYALADMIGTYWANFAKTGNPNGPGLPEWPQHVVGTRQNVVLNDTVSFEDSLELCNFWDSIGYTY